MSKSNWQPYGLDKIAQKLVLKYRLEEEKLNAGNSSSDQKQSILNEAHKMRSTVAYGLERFWGEHLRLLGKEQTKTKGEYWRDVWNALVNILTKNKLHINIPSEKVSPTDDTEKIRQVAQQFWDQDQFPLEDQRICLAILTQLCDSLVWWTQRYK